MPMAESLLSFADCQEVLDKALDASVGVSVTFATKGEAVHFRQRLYKFRKIIRKHSTEQFTKSDPRYGTSSYDTVVIVMKNDSPTLEVRRLDVHKLQVKDLIA